ncbi:DUF1542 domain-containing protein [Fructobacillus sp. W13]|uniref:DUF1542 domain-containing protein n=1 Tax=Fructobacillus apis TaxID=2935017 RepID=A0ABT0ZR53_9LACO|nr:DUF1542 domain-containing protein [Fructobacillus apis]MCO0832465.1 DUF1542 domain-containing protein [Fructobacillus apis]
MDASKAVYTFKNIETAYTGIVGDIPKHQIYSGPEGTVSVGSTGVFISVGSDGNLEFVLVKGQTTNTYTVTGNAKLSLFWANPTASNPGSTASVSLSGGTGSKTIQANFNTGERQFMYYGTGDYKSAFKSWQNGSTTAGVAQTFGTGNVGFLTSGTTLKSSMAARDKETTGSADLKKTRTAMQTVLNSINNNKDLTQDEIDQRTADVKQAYTDALNEFATRDYTTKQVETT